MLLPTPGLLHQDTLIYKKVNVCNSFTFSYQYWNEARNACYGERSDGTPTPPYHLHEQPAEDESGNFGQGKQEEI